MAHPAQRQFFERVKDKYPEHFWDCKVLDFGSLDVNGSLKYLFSGLYGDYLGIDIHDGKNVDMICKAHEFNYFLPVDTIVSGEMLEHDEHWLESLLNMYKLLKSGGLMVISAAGPTRQEHGTRKTTGDRNLWGTSPDYYENMSVSKLSQFIEQVDFKEREIELSPSEDDIYFYGIKS